MHRDYTVEFDFKHLRSLFPYISYTVCLIKFELTKIELEFKSITNVRLVIKLNKWIHIFFKIIPHPNQYSANSANNT